MLINISSQKIVKPESAKPSSLAPSCGQSQLQAGKWRSAETSISTREHLVFDFKEKSTINFAEMNFSDAAKAHFPQIIRIETSDDAKEWTVLFTESGFIAANEPLLVHLPLTSMRYIRFYFPETPGVDGKHYIDIERISMGIYGCRESEGLKEIAADRRRENLFDGKAESYFESEHKRTCDKVSITADLGNVFPVSKISLTAANVSPNAFPEVFSLDLSGDGKFWTTVVDQRKFAAENGALYSWNFNTVNARYARIEMNGIQMEDKTFANKLASFDIFASPSESGHHHSEITPLHASVFQAGIVKISGDGEASTDAVVRSDDRRLRDATTLFKGIVQFADNGASAEHLAVQANDNRIKPATESSNGIVRLAYDRESNSGCVVQASDSRLQEATEKQFGIVRLCPDGELSEMGVVKGSDSRLKKATEETFGICMLAPNEGAEAGTVVQGNDKRLKDATIFTSGIVQFAENGDDSENRAVMASDKRLKDATTTAKGIVELAQDGEATPGTAVQGSDRRLKDATTTAKGIVELAEDGENRAGVAVQGNDKRLLDASEKNKGIVILASDGESSPLKAVQSNDKRLKDATTTAKGIVELAEDGEVKEGCAVQSNDKRLKDATTATKGIMRFADNGEASAMSAVQGNDERLKDATTKTKGIMRFADNEEISPNTALQSNDDRIKPATENRKGIVQLCKDSSDTPGCAVQGNDRRLRKATEKDEGIMRFAQSGEANPTCAVQGSDERLKDATTLKKGIVELAENGEDREGCVVQGNDKRLKNADEDNFGIVRLAKNGESKKGYAVQSDDSRLNDKREPLAHSHEYAPLKHDFSSHSGIISVKNARAEAFSGITPPSENGASVYAENTSPEKGAAALSAVAGKLGSAAGVYGVIAHSSFIGVRGQSTGSENGGCGILGVSRFGAGGVFSSEHSYAVIADGFGSIDKTDSSLKLKGEGKALLVKGDANFEGKINISTKSEKNPEYPSNIVEMHVVDETDFISAGDLLVISGHDETLSKTHQPYNKGVVGVVSGNPSITINNNGDKTKLYPIALHGTVICKVDARNSPINPGDFIVTSPTPGCGMKGSIDSLDKIGTVIGKALTGLSDGMGSIKLIIGKF